MKVGHVLGVVPAVLIPAILSILLSVVIVAVGGDATKYEKGRKLFMHRCAGCHNIDPFGQRSFGPSLHEIGKVGAQRKSGMTAPEYILESIVDPGAYRAPGATGGMPDSLVDNEDDLRQLVGFLATRGASVRDEEIENLEIPEIGKKVKSEPGFDLGKIELGEAVFRGKGQCVSCHPLRQEPAWTLRGPSLLSIGSLSADYLRQAIEKPAARRGGAYQQVVAYTKDGRQIEGRLVEKTESGIYILKTEADGGLATVFVAFQEMEISGGTGEPTYLISGCSLMPSYNALLSREEIDAVVAFLKNRHGGYDW